MSDINPKKRTHQPILMTKKMEQHALEVSRDKESAKAFLVRAGLIRQDGKVAKEYR
ncbi:MAG: hypothetical protein ACQERP_12735 [Pseudomonadota bacterium]